MLFCLALASIRIKYITSPGENILNPVLGISYPSASITIKSLGWLCIYPLVLGRIDPKVKLFEFSLVDASFLKSKVPSVFSIYPTSLFRLRLSFSVLTLLLNSVLVPCAFSFSQGSIVKGKFGNSANQWYTRSHR